MNIKEYISSGILEAYVLGGLTEQERAEVEKYLVQFSELREELALVEAAQERMLMQAAIKPPSKGKTKLFGKINSAEGKLKAISSNKNSTFWRYAAAASFSIAIISSYLAYNYWGKWKEVSADLTSLVAQNRQVAKDYNQVNQHLNKLEQDILIMDDPKFKRVIMTGTANAPQASASVYWNASSKEVYLRIQDMKELSREKQYQLWAIIDGKPVDAGVFDGASTGLMKMKNIGTGVVTFAVTIESRGGNPSPTLETMQVAGNVDKG